jgi:single-stranded DNA-binding protein
MRSAKNWPRRKEVVMSIDTLIAGKLRGMPAFKVATTGSPYAVFKIGAADKDGVGVLCSCITFSSSVIATLQRLDDGDSAIVSGEASISTWQGRDGQLQTGLDVMVHLIQTAYHAGRKRGDKAAPSESTS